MNRILSVSPSLLIFAWGLIVALTQLGCEPQFNEDTCGTSIECFGHEVCVEGLCQPASLVETNKPQVQSFTVTPDEIDAGETVTVAWELTGAVSLTVMQGTTPISIASGGGARSGSAEVQVHVSTTFTLEAANSWGTTTVTADVDVRAEPTLPQIQSFGANPDLVAVGGTVTLSWRTQDATSGVVLVGNEPHLIDPDNLDDGSADFEVHENTLFTLEVTNDAGTVSEDIEVEVIGDAPTITSFSAEPAVNVAGRDINLNWRVAGAASLALSDDHGREYNVSDLSRSNDSFTVNPEQATTYTLVASNAFGEVSATTSVSVQAPLQVTLFEADPPAIVAGASSQLRWETAGSPTSVTVRNQANQVIPIEPDQLESGSVTVTPSQDTTYTITLVNNFQTVTAETTVEILPDLPIIDALTVDQTLVTQGTEVTFSWSVQGADELALEDNAGNAVDISMLDPASDDVNVTIDATATFTLTATNAGGSVTADVTVTVGGQVAITQFDYDDSELIASGDLVTLQWQVQNATALTLTRADATPINISNKSIVQDTVIVTPSHTTTYILTAQGAGGPVTAQLTVQIEPGVTITSFSANPSMIDPGQSATLSWSTEHATGIAITYQDIDNVTQTVDIGGASPSSGSVTVSPDRNTSYRLTAQGFNGPVSTTAFINVNIPVEIVSFEASKQTTVSGEAVVLSWVTTGADQIFLTNESNGIPISTAGLERSADSITLRPQIDTTYLFDIEGGNETDSASVSITVTNAEILITEIFYNADANANESQWVELYNGGDTFVDLAHYSLGNGSSDYLHSTLQLQGVLAPGECLVVPEGSFEPALDQGAPNGAAGVALFFDTAAAITAMSVPIDAIVYGDANTNGLLGEDGLAKTELSPFTPLSSSLERVSANTDVFAIQAAPSPGRCFVPVSVSPDSGLNDEEVVITISGFGIDPALDEISLGALQDLACSLTMQGNVECTVPTSGEEGLADLPITRIFKYIQNQDGEPVLTPVDLQAQESAILTDAYTFETPL